MQILHPLIAKRSCEHCIAYIYDEDTGMPVIRRGKYVKRPNGTGPPCKYRNPQTGELPDPETGAGSVCPKGTPENQHSLDSRNLLAYQHYLECKAVGMFPDDPVVRFNAATIMQAERQAYFAKYGASTQFM